LSHEFVLRLSVPLFDPVFWRTYSIQQIGEFIL
jgi:hypothetical protein